MAAQDISTTMRALVVQQGSKAAIKVIPVPTIADDEILVKVKAVALNPTDWKHIKLISTPGALVGIDFAGEVAKIGSKVDPKLDLHLGDTVVGSAHGGLYQDIGAFAEYTKVDSELVWKIPEGTLSIEEAVTLGVGLLTCIHIMWDPKSLALVEYPDTVGEDTWFYVHSGSTSVGQYAIQLAKLSGYKVITSGSGKNHEFLKSLGADVVFDYRDPLLFKKVKEASGDSIHKIFDCYSEKDSTNKCVKILAPGPGIVWTLMSSLRAPQNLRSDVKIESSFLYAMWGKPWKMSGQFYDPGPGVKVQIVEFLRNKLQTLIKEKKITPNRVKLGEGLDNINEGLKYMSTGKVSAEKLVYKI